MPGFGIAQTGDHAMVNDVFTLFFFLRFLQCLRQVTSSFDDILEHRPMETLKEGILRGVFRGFAGPGTIFEFLDGERWRQVCDTTFQCNRFMPEARIVQKSGKYFIYVEDVNAIAEVVPSL